MLKIKQPSTPILPKLISFILTILLITIIHPTRAYSEETEQDKVIVWKWEKIKKDFEETKEVKPEEWFKYLTEDKEENGKVGAEMYVRFFLYADGIKEPKEDDVLRLNVRIPQTVNGTMTANIGLNSLPTGIKFVNDSVSLRFVTPRDGNYGLWLVIDQGVSKDGVEEKVLGVKPWRDIHMDDRCIEKYVKMEERMKEIAEKYGMTLVVTKGGNIYLVPGKNVKFDEYGRIVDWDSTPITYKDLVELQYRLNVETMRFFLNPEIWQFKIKAREVQGEDGRKYKVLTIGAPGIPVEKSLTDKGKYRIIIYTEDENGNHWEAEVKVYLDKGEKVVDYAVGGVINKFGGRGVTIPVIKRTGSGEHKLEVYFVVDKGNDKSAVYMSHGSIMIQGYKAN